jgi:von Willebrand factor type A domain
MARRRGFNVISMSFLDAITCGFGAIILFFMIIAANVDVRRESTLENVSAEVDRMQLRVLTGRKNLVQMKQDLAHLLEDWASSQGVKQQLVTELHDTQEELDASSDAGDTRKELIKQLKEDLADLESKTEQLSAASITPEEAGDSIRSVTGEGRRQYLTGLRMGGKRVVILVDVSTSMLDRTLVNVLRRRNMTDEQKRKAPKWVQLVDTVDWLTAQIQPGTQFQVIAFNSEAHSLIDGTDGQWLTATDGSQLEAAVQKLRGMVAGGATSLHAAFTAARQLEPKADNIYLLVDGLPTMGEIKPSQAGVTSKERLNHFNRAVRELPLNVPVNVILLAMEGDPMSVPAYWTLALSTGGSMMAPSEDWP